MRTRHLVLLTVFVLLTGSCGDGTEPAPDASTEGESATVSVAPTSLGDVLVDGDGRTLYLFTKDEGETSTCTGGCASAWPALMVDGPPVAGTGVDEAQLGTNAAGQVTYGGRPLYRYAQDAEAGDVTGQGVGGVWFAVDADGNPIESEASAPSNDQPSPSY